MSDRVIASTRNEEQRRISERILEFATSVGRPDLVARSEVILRAEEEQYARVDEPAGYEMVAAQLKREENELSTEIQQKEKVWSEQQSSLRKHQVNEIREIVQSKWGIHETLNQIDTLEFASLSAKERAELLRTGLKNNERYGTAIRGIVERSKTLSDLIKDATGALSGYQRAKVLRTWIPRVLVLTISLLAFALGATLVGDSIQEQGIKIGFVLAIWGLQELWFVPFSEKKLSTYERDRLKHSIRSFYSAKLLFVLLASIVDHEFELETKSTEAESGRNS